MTSDRGHEHEGRRPEDFGTNVGHGHVWARPDGQKWRCGGPMLCERCATDLSLFGRQEKPMTMKKDDIIEVARLVQFKGTQWLGAIVLEVSNNNARVRLISSDEEIMLSLDQRGNTWR